MFTWLEFHFPPFDLKTAFANYTRLAKSLLGMSSLWMGEDHLVYVKGSGFLQSYSEGYLRYRYRDIQAFTVTKTSSFGFAALYLIGALFFAGIMVLTLVFNNGPFGPGMIALLAGISIPTLVFILLLLRHLLLGPTCRCVIQTSLKKDLLSPLNRHRSTTQCLEEIAEKIRQSQGEVNPAEFS